MVERNLAFQAKKIVEGLRAPKKHYVHYEFIRDCPIFDTVTGTVIYVGCANELSSFFLFENAACYIHQDANDPNSPPAMLALEKYSIISDFHIVSETSVNRYSEFSFKGRPKLLIEVHNDPSLLQLPTHEFRRRYDRYGNVGYFVPGEARRDLAAIYFFGMPYPDSIKAMQLNLLPYLEIGGVFEGPYPYASGKFEGADPEKLGLAASGGTYVKVRQLTTQEIQRIIRYSLEDYHRSVQDTYDTF